MSGRDGIRGDFAELLNSEDRRDIVQTLKDYVTVGKVEKFVCEKCAHPNERTVTDGKLRLDTLRWMTEQGLGRLLEEPRTNTDDIAARVLDDIDGLTDLELALLFLDPDDPGHDPRTVEVEALVRKATDELLERWQRQHKPRTTRAGKTSGAR